MTMSGQWASGRRVWVGGVRPRCTEASLRRHFEQYGAIAECEVDFSGIAFVMFESATSALKVCKDTGGSTEIEGRKCTVKIASDKGYAEAVRRRNDGGQTGAAGRGRPAAPKRQSAPFASDGHRGQETPRSAQPPPPPPPPRPPPGRRVPKRSAGPAADSRRQRRGRWKKVRRRGDDEDNDQEVEDSDEDDDDHGSSPGRGTRDDASPHSPGQRGSTQQATRPSPSPCGYDRRRKGRSRSAESRGRSSSVSRSRSPRSRRRRSSVSSATRISRRRSSSGSSREVDYAPTTLASAPPALASAPTALASAPTALAPAQTAPAAVRTAPGAAPTASTAAPKAVAAATVVLVPASEPKGATASVADSATATETNTAASDKEVKSPAASPPLEEHPRPASPTGKGCPAPDSTSGVAQPLAPSNGRAKSAGRAAEPPTAPKHGAAEPEPATKGSARAVQATTSSASAVQLATPCIPAPAVDALAPTPVCKSEVAAGEHSRSEAAVSATRACPVVDEPAVAVSARKVVPQKPRTEEAVPVVQAPTPRAAEPAFGPGASGPGAIGPGAIGPGAIVVSKRASIIWNAAGENVPPPVVAAGGDLVDICLIHKGIKKHVTHLSTTKVGEVIALQPSLAQLLKKHVVALDARGFEVGSDIPVGFLMHKADVGDNGVRVLELTLQADQWCE